MPFKLLPAVALCGLLWHASLQASPAQELFNFVRPLDNVQVQLDNAQLPDLVGEPNQQGEVLRRLTFNAGDLPYLALTPQQGVWDWSGQSSMSLRLQNAMDWDITVLVRIESSDGKVLESRVALPAGPAQTLLLPLHATSPRAHGLRAAPAQAWVEQGKRWLVATTVTGELSAQQVTKVTLALEHPQAAQSVLLGRFGSRSDDLAEGFYRNLIDAYGQSTRATWAEKISSEAQLKSAAQAEQKALKTLTKNAELDSFGGLLKGPKLEATGFFHSQQLNGRWYLVTPQGHAFYSLGVNAVTPNLSQTFIEGRESMFQSLPTAEDSLAAFYGQAGGPVGNAANKDRQFASGRWFDFYAANRQRSYGQADLSQWREQAFKRLDDWGFNTLGAWSESVFAGDQRMPYTVALSIEGDFSRIDPGNAWWGGVPDPFDPRFAMAAERSIAIAARDHREDPWLLGYFADNELAWAMPGNAPQERYALAYATLKLTTDVPAKRAFLKQLRDKYRNEQGLSAAWGIELKAWELMEDPGFVAPLPSAEHPQIEADLQRFLRLYADTYFKTLDDALDWHAPNHMLLGGRFSVSTPEAVAACAQYCDVLSFNLYATEPQKAYDFSTLKTLNKPVLVSEFHFGSRDSGPFWGGVQEVAKEDLRGAAYQNYLEQALTEPLIVGVHWFEYLDQPASGRLQDGENGHLGLVAITDRPWRGFTAQVRKANQALLQRLAEQSAEGHSSEQ